MTFDMMHFATHVVFKYRVAFDQQVPKQMSHANCIFNYCTIHAYDSLLHMQIVRRLYHEDVVAALPAYCRTRREIWRVLLICFYIVEWYFLDRIVHQFKGI